MINFNESFRVLLIKMSVNTNFAVQRLKKKKKSIRFSIEQQNCLVISHITDRFRRPKKFLREHKSR